MEPRKASDVLLALESKIDTLLNIVKSQDLNIKILSNKLSTLMENSAQQVLVPKIVVESVNNLPTTTSNNSRKIAVEADFKLPMEDFPKGFRRTSRPETYEGDNDYLNQKQVHPKFPVQLPSQAEVQVPSRPIVNQEETPKPSPAQAQNTVPVMQRIVDKNGKSVFLANIEIVDLSTSTQVYKTKTNATGKWMASLPIGHYRVSLSKRESLSKETIEVSQNIDIDGSSSTLNLSTLIIK